MAKRRAVRGGLRIGTDQLMRSEDGSYRRARSNGQHSKGGANPSTRDTDNQGSIVQTALKMTIEPVFEVQFRQGSYGSGRGEAAKTRCGKSIGC